MGLIPGIPDLSQLAEVGAFIERMDAILTELVANSRQQLLSTRRIENYLAKQQKAERDRSEGDE